MKKLLAILLSTAMLIGILSSCGESETTNGKSAEDASSSTSSTSKESSGSAEIALVCAAGSGGINDRGFFQSTYEGIQEFCEKYGHTYAYYETSENTIDALYETIDLAKMNSKMTKFTQTEYDKYVDMLINDTDGVNSSLIDPDRDDAQTVPEFWEKVPEHYITLNYFE